MPRNCNQMSSIRRHSIIMAGSVPHGTSGISWWGVSTPVLICYLHWRGTMISNLYFICICLYYYFLLQYAERNICAALKGRILRLWEIASRRRLEMMSVQDIVLASASALITVGYLRFLQKKSPYLLMWHNSRQMTASVTCTSMALCLQGWRKA